MTKLTFAELIGSWPRDEGHTSIRTFARDIGITYYKAQKMRHRSSIGADYWPAVLDAAKRRGVALTHKDLAEMRGRRLSIVGRPKQRTVCLAVG